MLLQVPGVVPVHVPKLGVWQMLLHVTIAGPRVLERLHSTAAFRQAAAPLHTASAPVTSAFR